MCMECVHIAQLAFGGATICYFPIRFLWQKHKHRLLKTALMKRKTAASN